MSNQINQQWVEQQYQISLDKLGMTIGDERGIINKRNKNCGKINHGKFI